MTVRRFVVALAATAAVAILVSSSGFSSVGAERGVSVAVTDDQSAFVGVETHPQTLPTKETPKRITLLTVTNNFDVRAHVRDVGLGGRSPPPKIEDAAPTKSSIAPGENGTVTANVNCGTGREAVTVDISVETVTGTYVSLSREVAIECMASHNGRHTVSDHEETTEDERADDEESKDRGNRSPKGERESNES